jgi:nucleotide-binding universal stress UspA family protein
MSGDIVVGIGPDSAGGSAARYAASLASRLGGKLVLVLGYEASALGPRGGPLEEQILEVATGIANEALAAIMADYPALVVETVLVNARPVDAILQVAEYRDADLVVVGHGGRGPLRAALLGSTTYELVHRAPVPVVVVPDDAAEE